MTFSRSKQDCRGGKPGRGKRATDSRLCILQKKGMLTPTHPLHHHLPGLCLRGSEYSSRGQGEQDEGGEIWGIVYKGFTQYHSQLTAQQLSKKPGLLPVLKPCPMLLSGSMLLFMLIPPPKMPSYSPPLQIVDPPDQNHVHSPSLTSNTTSSIHLSMISPAEYTFFLPLNPSSRSIMLLCITAI